MLIRLGRTLFSLNVRRLVVCYINISRCWLFKHSFVGVFKGNVNVWMN